MGSRIVFPRYDWVTNANLGNTAILVSNANAIADAVFRWHDAANTIQDIVVQRTPEDGKVTLNQMFLKYKMSILRNAVAFISIEVIHRICELGWRFRRSQ